MLLTNNSDCSSTFIYYYSTSIESYSTLLVSMSRTILGKSEESMHMWPRPAGSERLMSSASCPKDAMKIAWALTGVSFSDPPTMICEVKKYHAKNVCVGRRIKTHIQTYYDNILQLDLVISHLAKLSRINSISFQIGITNGYCNAFIGLLFTVQGNLADIFNSLLDTFESEVTT